jgi:hypothetical protein
VTKSQKQAKKYFFASYIDVQPQSKIKIEALPKIAKPRQNRLVTNDVKQAKNIFLLHTLTYSRTPNFKNRGPTQKTQNLWVGPRFFWVGP